MLCDVATGRNFQRLPNSLWTCACPHPLFCCLLNPNESKKGFCKQKIYISIQEKKKNRKYERIGKEKLVI
jgi:hypothetical protein